MKIFHQRLALIITFIGSEEPRHRSKATARTMEAHSAASSDGDYVMIEHTMIKTMLIMR